MVFQRIIKSLNDYYEISTSWINRYRAIQIKFRNLNKITTHVQCFKLITTGLLKYYININGKRTGC